MTIQAEECQSMNSIDTNLTAEMLINQHAKVDGGYKPFTVRLSNGKIGLATATYNHNQSFETKQEIARRIAALWNIAQGIPTEDLEKAAASGFRFRK
ncbi:hypothetical protein APB26_32615 [Pseudomonas aeruginosa]|nr:hypothetical protein APB26_32615 [Pseudomonas aeruginosa]RPV61399.1 hypothetical protein IPC838_18955 [Pseudomonas aeruginosa]